MHTQYKGRDQTLSENEHTIARLQQTHMTQSKQLCQAEVKLKMANRKISEQQ